MYDTTGNTAQAQNLEAIPLQKRLFFLNFYHIFTFLAPSGLTSEKPVKKRYEKMNKILLFIESEFFCDEPLKVPKVPKVPKVLKVV